MTDKEKKLHTLARIAAGLNASGVLWCVGASLLLYFHGLTDDFHDIDLMIAARDADKAEHVLSALGQCRPTQPTPRFGTRRFCEYSIEGIEVDMIAGFAIVAGDTEYDCDLQSGQIDAVITVEGERIPLQALGCWKRYYRLMGRTARAALLADIDER